MYISYFDEAGDDGFPEYSSPIFVLSSLYMDENVWKSNLNEIIQFRRKLKQTHGMPVKQEFHTKNFLADKDPYHGIYNVAKRHEIISLFFSLISRLDLKIINVVIDKKNIQTPEYDILDIALTYNVQRIENDLAPLNKKYIIITDEGRLAKMRRQVRKIQQINFIPSKYMFQAYRKEITNLIEDPISKESSESYFIQIIDTISTIVYLYALQNLCDVKVKWSNRILNVLSYGDEIKFLEMIKNQLNLAASKNTFGIVYYPKKKTL